MRNVWKELSKPIFCLAPMEDVTDTVFRQLLVDLGKPPLMFSEFTNVQHIYSHGSNTRRLEYTDKEKPLILQIWGLVPELYYNAAELAYQLGFDGVDINMGCPQPSIIKKGSCSALIDNHPLAAEIIQATIEGAKNKLPVSVKTRIGFKTVVTEEWMTFLLGFDIAALTIHGRTSKQMSKVPAAWDEIAKAVAIRNELKKDTLILGNGDILSIDQAQNMVDTYKVDGVMIGRGIFQDPWLFATPPVDLPIKTTKLKTLLLHVDLWDKTWGNLQDFNRLKRFFKIFCSGFAGASDLRVSLMECKTPLDVHNVIKPHLKD